MQRTKQEELLQINKQKAAQSSQPTDTKLSTLGGEEKAQTISSMAEVLMMNPATFIPDSRFLIDNLLLDFEMQNLKSTREDSLFYWLKLQNISSKKDVSLQELPRFKRSSRKFEIGKL